MKMLMKKTLRPVSIILAIVMILSSLTVGMTAWAADSAKGGSEDQPSLKDRIESMIKESSDGSGNALAGKSQKEQWAEYEKYFKETLKFVDPNMMLYPGVDKAMGDNRIDKTATYSYMAKLILENYDFLYETFITVPNSRSDITQPGGRYWTQAANYTVFDNDQYIVSRLLRVYSMLLFDYTKFDWKWANNNNDTAIKFIVSDQMDFLNNALKNELANGSYTKAGGTPIVESEVLAGANRNASDYTSAEAAVESNITKRMLMLFNGFNTTGSGHLLETGANGSQKVDVPFLFVVYDVNDYKATKDIPDDIQPLAVLRNQNRKNGKNYAMHHDNTGFFGSYFGKIASSYSTEPRLKKILTDFDLIFTKERLDETDVSKMESAQDMRKLARKAKTTLERLDKSKITQNALEHFFGSRGQSIEDVLTKARTMSASLNDYVSANSDLPAEWDIWARLDDMTEANTNMYLWTDGSGASKGSNAPLEDIDRTALWDYMAQLIIENYDFLNSTFGKMKGPDANPNKYWMEPNNFTVSDDKEYTIAQILRIYYTQFAHWRTWIKGFPATDKTTSIFYLTSSEFINDFNAAINRAIGTGITTPNGTPIAPNQLNVNNQTTGTNGYVANDGNRTIVQKMFVLFNGYNTGSSHDNLFDKYKEGQDSFYFTVSAPADYSYLYKFPTIADIPGNGIQTQAFLENATDNKQTGTIIKKDNYTTNDNRTGFFENYAGKANGVDRDLIDADYDSKGLLEEFGALFTKDLLNLENILDLDVAEMRDIVKDGATLFKGLTGANWENIVNYFFNDGRYNGNVWQRANELYNEIKTFLDSAKDSFIASIAQLKADYGDKILVEGDLDILAEALRLANIVYSAITSADKKTNAVVNAYKDYNTLLAKLTLAQQEIYTVKYNTALAEFAALLQNDYVRDNFFGNPVLDDDANGTLSKVLEKYTEIVKFLIILQPNRNTAPKLGEQVLADIVSLLGEDDTQTIIDNKMEDVIAALSCRDGDVPKSGVVNVTVETRFNPLLTNAYSKISDIPVSYNYTSSVLTYRYTNGEITTKNNITVETGLEKTNTDAKTDFNNWSNTYTDTIINYDVSSLGFADLVNFRNKIEPLYNTMLAKYSQRTRDKFLVAPVATEAQVATKLAEISSRMAVLFVDAVAELVKNYGHIDNMITDLDVQGQVAFVKAITECQNYYAGLDETSRNKAEVIKAKADFDEVYKAAELEVFDYLQVARQLDNYFNSAGAPVVTLADVLVLQPILDEMNGRFNSMNPAQKQIMEVAFYQDMVPGFQNLIDQLNAKKGWTQTFVDYSNIPNANKDSLLSIVDDLDALIDAIAPQFLKLPEGKGVGDFLNSTIENMLIGGTVVVKDKGGNDIEVPMADNIINSLMSFLYPMVWQTLAAEADKQTFPANLVANRGSIEGLVGIFARPRAVASNDQSSLLSGQATGAKYQQAYDLLMTGGTGTEDNIWDSVDTTHLRWIDTGTSADLVNYPEGEPIHNMDTFYRALGSALAPVWPLIRTVLFGDDVVALGIMTAMWGKKGFKNVVIPFYKQLGCSEENLVVQYGKNNATVDASDYNAVRNMASRGNAAESIKVLLTPVFNRISDIGKTPVNGLMEILPQLAYMFHYDLITKGLNELVSPLSLNVGDMLAPAGIDLSDLNGLIQKFIPKNEDGSPIVNIPMLNTGEIAGIAKGKQPGYSNVSAVSGAKLTVKKDEMLIYLLRFALDVVDQNREMIDGLLDTAGPELAPIVKVGKDILDKPNDDIINALVGFLNPKETKDTNWDMSGWDWEKGEATYPKDGSVDAKQVATALEKLDVAANKILTELLGSDIKGLVKGNLFTEKNLNDLIMTVYRALDETIVIPEDLPNGVKESTLVGTLRLIGIDPSKEVLAAAIEGISPDAAAKILAVNKYTELDLTGCKWNIDVTDSDNFAIALARIFKPFNPLLKALLNASEFRIFDAIPLAGADGYSNSILPILNALGCKDVLTAGDYNEAINGNEDTQTPGNEDAILTSILMPLFDSLNDIAENPLSEIATRLPNIANFLDNNGLSKAVYELVKPITNLIDPIFQLVSGKTETTVPGIVEFALETFGIELEGFDLNDLEASIVPTVNGFLKDLQVGGLTLSLQLPEIDWGKLAGHGTQVDGSSFGSKLKNFFRGTQPKDYRIEGDKGDAAMAVLNYAFDTVKMNKDSLLPLLEDVLGANEGVKNFAVSIINKVLDNTSENISGALIKTINADNPADVDWNAYDFLWNFAQAMYPENITTDRADKAIATIDSAIKNILWEFLNTDANKLVSGLIYTDANLKAIVEALYGALAGQEQILDMLGIKLPTVESLNLNGSTREGFVNGLSKAIAPFAPVLEVLLNGGNLEFVDGGITLKGANGYKNSIIPMLYAFGCTDEDIMSPSDYKNALKDGNKDVLVSAIINPILNVVERILNNPVSEITGMLPNFAYFISNGGFTKALDALLLPITNLTDPVLSLVTGDSFLTFVFDTVEELAGISIPVDPDNIEDAIVPLVNGILTNAGIAIEIPEINWAKLAGCGELKNRNNPIVAALSGSGKSVMNRYVQANKADAFIEIMRYAVGIIYYKNNPTTIKNLVAGIVSDSETDLSILNDIISNILASNDSEMISMIIKILVPDTTKAYANWTYPIVPKTIQTSYTPNLNREDYENGLAVIDETLLSMISSFAGFDSLTSLLGSNLYTSDMINTIAGAIFGALDPETLGMDIIPLLQSAGIDLSPLGVGKNLVESKYKSVSSVLRKAETWKDVDFATLDWGFEKGDRDGFLKTLVALLRPLEDVLAYVLAGEDFVVLDSLRLTGGEGYNNAIIPLLEALGCKDILSAKQYKENAKKNKDAMLLDILNPLFNKIESVLAKPVDSLTEMLPNIALFMANNGVKQLADSIILPVTQVLNTIAPVYEVKLDLSILEDMDVTKMVNDLLGGIEGMNVKILPISFTTLAARGETKMVESLRVDAKGNRVTVPVVEADKPAVLVSVLRYIVEVIKVPENLAALSKLVEGDPTLGSLVGGILSSIGVTPTDETVEMLMQLLTGISLGEEEDLPLITPPKNNVKPPVVTTPGNVTVPPQNNANGNNNNNNGKAPEQTPEKKKNYIPLIVAGSAAAVIIPAGAAGFYIYRKRKMSVSSNVI